MPSLIYLDEPTLLFNYEQAMLDPRDGLTLFGPLDRAKPDGIRWAAIGPKDAIRRMKAWVQKIQAPVVSGDNLVARPVFPGFEAAFNSRWNPSPVIEIEIDEQQLFEYSQNEDRHQRVFRMVDMFASRIQNSLRSDDVSADVWCVVIPEFVYQFGRPKSVVPSAMRREATPMTAREAKKLVARPSLFPDENKLAEEYLYEVNFHHQLKARLLKDQTPIQIVRETTIAHRDFLNALGNPTRDFDALESAIAWTISTAVFYKAGGRPWKLGAGREGVCYIGLVFKQDDRNRDPRTACCAAQMFLDNGDGVVFKGAVGPWYQGRKGHYHLEKRAASEVMKMCIEAYANRNNGKPPAELFIHGKVGFNNDEWEGFQSGAGSETRVVGVRIRPVSFLKLFRKQDHPILRGMAFLMDDRKGLLWTNGLIPRLLTYPGREVPNPLLIDVCRGDADLRQVMADVLALTKLNYNACNFADGQPVTLKFANAVGEILTAAPVKMVDVPPLPFKYYI